MRVMATSQYANSVSGNPSPGCFARSLFCGKGLRYAFRPRQPRAISVSISFSVSATKPSISSRSPPSYRRRVSAEPVASEQTPTPTARPFFSTSAVIRKTCPAASRQDACRPGCRRSRRRTIPQRAQQRVAPIAIELADAPQMAPELAARHESPSPPVRASFGRCSSAFSCAARLRRDGGDTT